MRSRFGLLSRLYWAPTTPAIQKIGSALRGLRLIYAPEYAPAPRPRHLYAQFLSITSQRARDNRVAAALTALHTQYGACESDPVCAVTCHTRDISNLLIRDTSQI